MIYKIFVTEDGAPKTGLMPTWNCLYGVDGTEKTEDAPAITEIGGGWYKIELIYGNSPFDVAELVGVIDAGIGLANHERFLPITISLRDLGLAKLVNKATYDLSSGVETIWNDDVTASELQMTLSQSGSVETREICGGGA